jgi:hypothetical protein
MKKYLIIGGIALCIAVISKAGWADDLTQIRYLEESRKTAMEFMQKLGGTLKKQIETGGVESAIGVCKQVAPALAADYSKNDQVVKRVSLKVRNKTQGTPDAWELGVLEKFDQNQREGKPDNSMEVNHITQDADGKWFRYMKAIPTQPMCLQCHGKPTDIPATVKASLAKEYPEDKAVGYSIGEIRGAISIKRKLIRASLSEVDKRQVLALSEVQREHVLNHMRFQLTGVQNILAALYEEDMVTVNSYATSLGMNMTREDKNPLRGVMPKEYSQIGMSLRQDFDQIALDANEFKDAKYTLRQLGNAMNKCAACHASYQIRPNTQSKLELVSIENVTK